MRRVVVLLTVAAAALVGCGGQSDGGLRPEAVQPSERASESSASRTSPEATASPAKRPGTGVKAADSQFGRVLFDRPGQAIYYFAKEKTRTPDCYGPCASAWPPVLTDGPPRALGDVRQSLLGTTERRDGSRQVTYDGRPLYFYAHEGRNVVLCHNVTEFGGLWLAVAPSGKPIP
ncbi:MAG: COG4315 family predicted lipoprotein [Actinomycetes bacterium]